MTELSPTEEHLKDPYVLQLIEALSMQQDRIEELEEGACRFNCRRQKEAFVAGWNAHTYRCLNNGIDGRIGYTEEDVQIAFKEWERKRDD